MIIIHIKLGKIEKINCRTAYNPTIADQPDELIDLTNLPLPSRINILTEVQDAVVNVFL